MKVGDRVVLSPHSEFVGSAANPLDTVGTVYGAGDGHRLDIGVKWDNGDINSYHEEDLRLVGMEGGYEFPKWLEMKRPAEGQSGLVVGHIETGTTNSPTCWLVTDRAQRKIWTCNAAFRRITPAEAALMLLALQELEDEHMSEVI